MIWMSWLLAAAAAGTPLTIGEGEVPPGWVAIDPPSSGSGWQCVYDSRVRWTVGTAPGGRLSIAPRRPRTNPSVRVDLADGTLIGTDHGEFEGTIEWKPKDRSAGFVMKYVNAIASTQFGGEVYILEGLGHLGAKRGVIFRFERRDARSWRIHRPVILNEAPRAAADIDHGQWTVLTHTGLIRVDLHKRSQQTVYENNNWPWIQPDSVRTLGDSWLVGAGPGVIRLSPLGDGYVEQWWVPRSCRSLEPVCDCGSDPRAALASPDPPG